MTLQVHVHRGAHTMTKIGGRLINLQVRIQAHARNREAPVPDTFGSNTPAEHVKPRY